MLERFTLSDTNTFEEVNRALNILVDAQNANEEFNAEVEEYNISVGAQPKKSNKKGGK